MVDTYIAGLKEWHPMSFDETDEIQATAAANGDLDELVRLSERCMSSYVSSVAAFWGHVHILEWKCNKLGKAFIDMNEVMWNGAQGGQMHVCEWAHDRGAGAYRESLEAAASDAARAGHSDIKNKMIEWGARESRIWAKKE